MNKFVPAEFNKYVSHPLQAFEWGDFRTKTGVKVIRRLEDDPKNPLAFQLTIHKIPKTSWNVGYLPKGSIPTPRLITELKEIGKQENCIFIQLEPNVVTNPELITHNSQLGLKPAARPLFTKYTFVLDLTKTEEELLQNFHPKTRYNIKVAQKKGVEVVEDNSDKAFKEYLRLSEETTSRQKFYAHGTQYHKKMWETLKVESSKLKVQSLENRLTAHLLTANFQHKTLVAWIVFILKDTLYYPYGASSSENREVMASNLMMFEAIKFGKKHNLKKFDMWGALSENPDPKDEWYGFHRFKQGYGPKLVEFVGSYDLVINPILYELFKFANSLRWLLLKFRK